MNGLTLVLGLASEPPVAAVTRELERLGAEYILLDQRRLVTGGVAVWWSEGRWAGAATVDGTSVPLADVTAVYTRLTTWAELPEVAAEPALLPHARDLHVALESWLETTDARVVNRTSANDSNNSKPYQALLIREYFEVPTTLVTTDPAAALSFRQEFGEVIYKSISGERSIVTAFTDADLDRLPLLVNGPVQFQEHVRGVDVRVHVVGPEVFAAAVQSDSVDYRYDGSGGRMSPVELPDTIAERCRALTRRLGLELSGIDFRLTDDGRFVCFEVNPSPVYTVYEEATGQPIAAALARHLSFR